MHENKISGNPYFAGRNRCGLLRRWASSLMKIYTNLLKYIKIIYITLMRIYIAFISFILLLMYNENIIK